VIGRDGQYAGWSDPANFTDPEGTLRYILNPDVQIPNWLGFTASAAGLTSPLNREQAVETYEIFRRWGVQPSSAADVYDGIYFDSTNTAGNGWTGWHLFNFRREHFATTSVPLVFDPQSGKVALSQALSSVAAMKRLADLMHGRGEIVMANALADPFIFSTGAFCDVVSPGEGYDGTLSVLREVRAASYAKPISYLYNNAVTDQQFQHAMLYAVFPGGAGISGNRSVYQRWAPIMMKIGAAGWEPLSFARSDDLRVLVERYGRLDRSTLHFVVHRESGGTAASNLLLEKAALGIGADVKVAVRDVASGAAMTAVDNGETLSLPLTLALEQSAVLAVTAISGTPGPTAGETLPSDAPPSGGGGSGGGGSGGSGGGSGGSASTPVAASSVGSGCSTGAAGPGVFGLLALAFALTRRRSLTPR
jgi:MYXO-CTERM domain-containing protein